MKPAIKWNSPGAMSDYDCYHNGYYMEIYPVEPDGEVIGYRWEVRRENDWLDPEPLDYGIVGDLTSAKSEAERVTI